MPTMLLFVFGAPSFRSAGRTLVSRRTLAPVGHAVGAALRSRPLGRARQLIMAADPSATAASGGGASADPAMQSGAEGAAPFAGESAADGVGPTIVEDNESDFYGTLITVTCQDRPGLLADITSTLEEMDVRVSKVVARTEGGVAKDVFTVTRDGAKLDQNDLEEVRMKLFPTLGKAGMACDMATKPSRELSIDPTELHHSDRDPGVRVYVDNYASGAYTMVMVSAPDRPNLVADIIELVKYMELNITFASLSNNASYEALRHDVFHVTKLDGRKLDSASCDNLRNSIYFLLMAPSGEEDSY
ncbi:hypothetical protein CDCA_CDCA08G2470 [Cyanidium caldarium]|uniref:ACT domain-containing protein n=1 Tax=Cyanidium caldarium TaxID=2771 RepID=A0AAV9IWH2_CYACA|nr:hypothetical protein CDCA_CDCA08G2470 [Cyanidium caldarium]